MSLQKLIFADDMALIADSEKVKNNITIYEEELVEINMEINLNTMIVEDTENEQY